MDRRALLTGLVSGLGFASGLVAAPAIALIDMQANAAPLETWSEWHSITRTPISEAYAAESDFRSAIKRHPRAVLMELVTGTYDDVLPEYYFARSAWLVPA